MRKIDETKYSHTLQNRETFDGKYTFCCLGNFLSSQIER